MTTFGFFGDSQSADNFDIRFHRFPLEVIGSYSYANWRFGGGLSAHISPRFTTEDKSGNKASVDMDTTVGPLLTIAYQWTHFRAGARAMFISYKGSDLDGSIDGNSYGAYMAWVF